MREASIDLESTLDGLIARLTKASAAKGAKAVLVDARRLRTVVGNWRTIEPTDDARKEMGLRVQQLVSSVQAIAPAEAAPRQVPAPAPPPVQAAQPERRSVPIAEPVRPAAMVEPAAPRRGGGRAVSSDGPIAQARSAPPMMEELTRAAPLATQFRVDEERATARINGGEPTPMRHRTLPDLDISGIAELVDDGPAHAFDDSLDGRPAARLRRGESPAPRARISSDPPARDRQSSSPPNGKRREASERPAREASDRPGRGNRPSRFLIDPATEADGDEGPGPVYSDDAVVPAPARITRAPSDPSPIARESKIPIAVRPLPSAEVLDKRLVLLNEPYSARAEAYRALRRKLSGPGAPRTIAVTSAQPGEGKTSCAVNLALAFRETSNEKILLIEANLRSPSLARTFGFEPPVCFAKQMARNRDTARASWTVVEQFEPLHVLAVDPGAKNPPLLDPVAFANALEQLVEAGYDHIIVDTPPALGGSDVNLVADAVDGIVVVAWMKKSKKSLVKKAIDQLKPATILGVVMLEG